MPTLAIDAGTTVIKAVIFSEEGRELATVERPTNVTRPFPGWSEQDMNEVWENVVSACHQVVSTAATKVDVVTVTAQGDGAWLIDRNGEPIRPAILWNDARSASDLAQQIPPSVAEKAFAINGSRANLGLPNAILLWLRRAEPEALARTHSVLTCGSWIFFKLTGVIGQHASEASAPWLDIQGGAVSSELLSLYGIADLEHLIPRVWSESEVVHPVKRMVAEHLGLSCQAKAVIAPFDVVTTAAGGGVTELGDAFAILGTTICPGVVVSRPQLDGLMAGLNLYGVGDGQYIRAFPTITGTHALAWLSSFLGLEGVPSLISQAQSSSDGSNGVLWLPYLSLAGERAPFFDPSATGVLFGLQERHSQADIARALLESLSYVIREALESSGETPNRLTLSGGGSRSDFWCQIIADISGLVTARSGDSQIGAKGAHVYSALSLGTYPNRNKASEALVTPGVTFTPKSSTRSLHDDRYALFLELRARNQPLWARAQDIYS